MDTSCVFGGISLEVSLQSGHLRHSEAKQGLSEAEQGQRRASKGKRGQRRAREAKGKKPGVAQTTAQ